MRGDCDLQKVLTERLTAAQFQPDEAIEDEPNRGS